MFDDNSAGKSGGGLNNYGPINVAGCTMRRNGAPSWGGGSICAYGSVTVSDSLLLDNNSKGGGSWGGVRCCNPTLPRLVVGLLMFGSHPHQAININGNLALTNVTLDGNAADGSGGAVYLGTFAQSGGPVGLLSTLRVRGLVLSHSAGASGGLYADSGVTVDIAGATFVANAAAGDGAALIVQGGGVYSRILDSSFVGNTASGGRGGALWLGDSGSHSLQRVVFASNAAGISGGALFSASGRMAVSDSSFTSNSVGGMYCRGGAMSIESLTGGDTVFTNTTFASNSNLAPLLPASVLDSAFSLVYAAGDALFDAPPGAGASFGQGKARIVSRPPCHRCAEPVSCQAGALFVACAFAVPSPLSLSLNGCSFSANTALYGGALAVPASGAVALSIDGGAFSTNSAGVDGGALWLAGGATVASRTTFVNNTALAGDGGVAHASGSATRVALSSVGAASNAAPAGRGGVLALRAGAAAISAGGAWGANAAFGGGCVYVATNDSPPPFAALSGTSLSGNAATAGGVWLVDAPPPGANTSVLAPPVCAPSACAFEGAANAAPLGPLFATLPCAAAVAAPPWVHSGAALAANVSLLDAFGQSASSWPTLLVTASCASPCAQPTLGGLTTAPFVPSPPPAASSAAGSRLPGVASFPLLTLSGSVNASVAVAFRLSSPSLGAFDGASVVAFISVSPCNAATESFDPASLRCVCSPGASSSTGACDLCPPGRVSPSAGAALCAPCPSNTFASPNRTQCTPCPASSLAPPGTAGVGGCVCPFSTYAVPAVPSEPFSGWFACSPCPPGALCVGTGGPPLATAGFWHPPGGARSMFYDCSAGLCLAEDPLAPLSPDNASTCAPGQAGPVCGVCLPDYALQGGGGCAPCPAGGALTAWPAPARAAVAVAAALAFVAASLPPLLAPLFPEKVSRALDSLSRLFRRWRWGDRAAQTTENDDADMEPVSPRGVAAAFSPRGGGATPNAPTSRPSFSSTPRPKPDPPPPSQWGDVALTPAPRSFGASLSLRQRRPSSGGGPAVVPPPLHPGSPRASSVLLHAAAAAEGGAAAPLAAIPSTRLSFIEDGTAAAAKAAGGGETDERSALVADGARGWVVPFFVSAVAFCSEPLRVVTTCVQIVSSFQRTMRIPWPRVYYDVSSRLSFLDLNFMRLPRAACAAPSSNFYATFNGTTLSVTALLAYVAACWAAGDAYARREGLSPATRSLFAHATLAKALLVLDVAFAPLSQTILAVFSCRSIGNESFLRADLSLQCGTPRHAFYTRLAMFWLIVYPLGTPILYVCLLCYYRIPSAARRLRDVAGLRAVVDEAWLRGIPQPEGVNTSLLTPDNIGDDHIDALLHGLRGGGSRCGALLSRDAKLQALLAWARKHTSRTHYTARLHPLLLIYLFARFFLYLNRFGSGMRLQKAWEQTRAAPARTAPSGCSSSRTCQVRTRRLT